MDNDTISGAEGLPSLKPKTTGFKHTAKRLRNKNPSPSFSSETPADQDWQEAVFDVCAGDTEETGPDFADLKEILMKSRTAEILLSMPNRILLQYDVQVPTAQMYVAESGVILTFNPSLPKGFLLHLFARELRRAHQHFSGTLINPMTFEPEEAVLVNRAQQADTLVSAIKIAWELKLAGENEAWDFTCLSSCAEEAHAFEAVAQKDFRTLSNGEAMRAAYDRFFNASGVKAHDKRLIHQMLLDDQGYIKSQSKRQKAGHDFFLRLGETPSMRNYLALPGKMPPTDSVYAKVEDRSNANFLWFIKFECSFQEKEAEMVKDSIVLSGEIVDFATARARRHAGPNLKS